MKCLLPAILACALILGAAGPRVTRVSLAAMEKSMDKRVGRLIPEDPYLLIGYTRGIYVQEYGAVFTFEVNLVASAALSPFGRTSFTKEEIAKLREKKQQRVFQLKQSMREMMMASAASLDAVPAEERIVVGASILYYNWEDTTGLPRQIVMQAQRKHLIAAIKGDRAVLDSELRVQEY